MAWLIMTAVIAVPVVEIMVWIKAAELMGFWSTLGLSIAAVMVGTAILRRQGLAVLLNAQSQLAQGEMPLAAAFDGLCLAAAGFLFALPGFVSDAVAVALLLPPVRGALRGWVGAHMVVMQPPPSGPVTIDGDFTVVEPEPSIDTKRLEH
ncbi:biotin--acetyl-CoA-carboxylase ligase [Paramagnetospirillum kuznetsovii]|uniref:Biotin--acetyl-CoA-carboxylase ligase n=1 Tax=Paramagnetospirillum kuznetsovii TaxID=2053833 RepID=A0A364P3L6_9PROT|nr:FxsA family protein [Paramagnetospirillum kuznetsovii]RAU23705.1 biotin--acetyl-CoA-carboxylase ligase [Paramagnetospirillum kuznetsovii]